MGIRSRYSGLRVQGTANSPSSTTSNQSLANQHPVRGNPAGAPGRKWWSRWGSNPRPPDCEPGALPTELLPQHDLRQANGLQEHGGESGIRTHGRGVPYTRFPVVCLRPLGHLSTQAVLWRMAERVGFEPTVTQKATTVFETAPIDHSGTSPMLLRRPQGREKRLQLLAALRPQNTTIQVAPMVQAAVLQQIMQRSASPGLRIHSTKHHPRNPRQDDGTRAHRARFQGNVQCGSIEATVPRRLDRRTNGQHLSVRGGILKPFRLVPTQPDDAPLSDHQCPNRDITMDDRLVRKVHGLAHPVAVAGQPRMRIAHRSLQRPVLKEMNIGPEGCEIKDRPAGLRTAVRTALAASATACGTASTRTVQGPGHGTVERVRPIA
jgi:hypothetical protein